MTESEREITELRRGDRHGAEAYTAVWNAVLPRYPITPDELERSRQRRSGRRQARRAPRLGGCRVRRGDPLRSSRQDVHGRASFCRSTAGAALGRGLLERVVVAARGHGSEILAAGLEEGDVDGEAFAERFGLREVLREVEVVRAAAVRTRSSRRRSRGSRSCRSSSVPNCLRDLRPRQRDDAGDAAPRALHHARLRAVARGGRDGRRRDRRRHARSRSTRDRSWVSRVSSVARPTRISPSTASPGSRRRTAAAASRRS